MRVAMVFLLTVMTALIMLPSLHQPRSYSATLTPLQQQLAEQTARARSMPEDSTEQSRLQAGSVEYLAKARRFSTSDMQFQVHLSGNSADHFNLWSSQRERPFTASAQGLDGEHYFVNSYLIGFAPFRTDLVWAPLYTLARAKKYQFDHVQYGGRKEVWQNSKQAWYQNFGDCEDHALLLADWLISQGHQTRVALGRWKQNGHAWVVLRWQGQDYVLEATSKNRRHQGINLFIPARLAVDYHPDMQFDRKNFWVNNGSSLTVEYFDSKWQNPSRYLPPLL